MIRFNNDYSRGAHPEILKALLEYNDDSFAGYGMDDLSTIAADEIRVVTECPKADVHFVVGGTQANALVITAALRNYESVLAADSGHINTHETGAVEHSGHKVEPLKSTDGKITAAQIREAAENYAHSTVPEHITMPRMVYISFPTEYGTTYSLRELEEISEACGQYGLYLFIDGARLGYGLAAEPEISLAKLAKLADVFYIGGTKCGALFGEAIVIVNDELKQCFRNNMKQQGALLAKGWLAGLQFKVLFRDGLDGLYFEITKKAVRQAMRLKQAFADAGIPFYLDSPTNQQFVLLTDAQTAKLSEKYVYEYMFRTDEDHHCIRFCTSWYTKDEEVDELIADISEL